MSEWWTYTLSDFLLFSDRVYYRLFELHNNAFWPAHILTLLIGAALFYAIASRTLARGALTVLGMLWLWIAWSFFWQRYASINWAAAYIAPAFVLQGLALIGAGIAGRVAFAATTHSFRRAATGGLFILALVGYPLIAPLLGRPGIAAEFFGIAPDPTAVATLAVLAAYKSAAPLALMVIPALWCVVTGATLWTLGAPEFFMAPLAVAVALAAAARRA